MLSIRMVNNMFGSKYFYIFFSIGIIVYFNALFNNFVWDDLVFVINNPVVQQFNLLSIFPNNTPGTVSYFRPVANLYFAILYALFHYNVFGYHLICILIHIVNTYLIYVLFKKYFSAYIAFFLSLVFLVHPLNVEAVSYISGSLSEIFFFFGITAFFLYQKNERKYELLASVLLLFSALIKEAAIGFFIIITLFFFLFEKKKFIRIFTYVSITGAIYLFLRFFIFKTYFPLTPMIPMTHLSFDQRLIQIPKILSYYFMNFFWPDKLAVDQLWIIKTLTAESFYLPLFIDFFILICISISGLIFIAKKNTLKKVWIFFLVWFLSGMLPLLQLFPLDMTVADRWFYFAEVGFLGITGILLMQILPAVFKQQIIRKLIIATGVIIILLLSIRTMVRNTNWYDEITLYNHDRQLSDNFDIENNLGVAYDREGKYLPGLEHIKKSVAIFPHETNVSNLGVLYEHLGKLDKAENYYRKSLLTPDYSITLGNHQHELQTYINLAAYLVKYDLKKAGPFLQKALQDYPNSKRLWLLLSYTRYHSGDEEGAFYAAQQAYISQPDDETRTAYFWLRDHLNRR